MGPNLGLVWASHNITVLSIYKEVHGQSKCFFQQTASSAIHSFKELELISTLAQFNSCWIFPLLCSAFFLSLSRFPFHAFKRPFISFLGKEIASNLFWIASEPPGQHIFASTVTIRYKNETKKILWELSRRKNAYDLIILALAFSTVRAVTTGQPKIIQNRQSTT